MDHFQLAIRAIIAEIKTSNELKTWADQYDMTKDPYLVMRMFQLICAEIERGPIQALPETNDPEFDELVRQTTTDWFTLVEQPSEHQPDMSRNSGYTPRVLTTRIEGKRSATSPKAVCKRYKSMDYEHVTPDDENCDITIQASDSNDVLALACVLDGVWDGPSTSEECTPRVLTTRIDGKRSSTSPKAVYKRFKSMDYEHVTPDEENCDITIQKPDSNDELALACVLDGEWDGAIQTLDSNDELALACVLDGEWDGAIQVPDSNDELALACVLDGEWDGISIQALDSNDDLALTCLMDGEWDGTSTSEECPTSRANQRGKRLPCKYCGQLFRRMSTLRQHLTSCHQQTITPDHQYTSTSTNVSDTIMKASPVTPIVQSVQNCADTPRVQSPDPSQVGLGRLQQTYSNLESRSKQTPYTITFRHERHFAKKAAVEKIYDIKFNNEWRGQKLSELHAELHDMFDDVLAEARGNLAANDLGTVVIRHQSLTNAIIVPIRKLETLNADVVIGHIEKVLSSHNELRLDESFEITIGTIDMPKGATSKYKITNVKESIKLKHSIVEIQNQDNMCLARSLAVCYAKACTVENETDWDVLLASQHDKSRQTWLRLVLEHKICSKKLYHNMKDPKSTVQTRMAQLICQKAGVPHNRAASLADIPAFEEALGCHILVVSGEMGNKFIRKVESMSFKKKLFVFLTEDEHWDAIPNISGFFGMSYFCDHCLAPYSNSEKHECDTHCRVCKRTGCEVTDTQISCRSCHMTCRSIDCFENHKKHSKNRKGEPKLSQCEKWNKCKVCYKVLKVEDRSLSEHVCGEYKCKLCHLYVPQVHLCYHQPKQQASDETSKFLFFDFESVQDIVSTCLDGYDPTPCITCPGLCRHHNICSKCHNSWCGHKEHRPNFVVAQTVCENCKNKPMETSCANCGSRCNDCGKWDVKKKSFESQPCPNKCGLREVIFRGDNTASEFCTWLFSGYHKQFTVFAHNFKGYDGYFILEYLLKNTIIPDCLIYNGSKIMYMHVQRGLDIRLLDSLSFFNTKLANLPKMFHLKELRKGYFPHFFNIAENQNYVGSYPDVSFYGLDSMSTEGRADFMSWHGLQKDEIFDFAKEMEDYCRSDVDILRRSVMTFRELLQDITKGVRLDKDPTTGQINEVVTPGVDPTAYVTIASVCMGVFKQKFLHPYEHVKLGRNGRVWGWFPSNKDKSLVDVHGNWIPLDDLERDGLTVVERETLPSPIAMVPSEGYVRKDQYSKVSLQWLEWLMYSDRDTYIQHALNEGEYLVPGTKYKADGYCERTKTIYQFDGCLFHGCSTCYPHGREKTVLPRTQQTISELYALTMKRNVALKTLGYKLITIWEHEFSQNVKTNDVLKSYINTLDLQERLDPRDSFFGGRTNAIKLYHEASEEEEISYLDFTSLYPFVNKTAVYPVGHPTIITRDFKNLDQYFGLAKGEVQPPRGLYHPVLPYRSNDKLKFPLCKICADTEQQDPCQHTDDERSFVGTWCIPELLKAVENGYKVTHIFEVYHWPETTCYDPYTKTGGLFTDYINTFLKIKQEASGWPYWCNTQADKDKYVRDYEAHEDITLDHSKIQKNPGLRALAKLMLNSFWGKFGQRSNMTQSKFISKYQLDQFYSHLTDPSKTMQSFHVMSESVAQIQWTHEGSFTPENESTNIFIATFTTCYARLKLYGLLDTLQERILYMDTDSVVFTTKRGQPSPSTGDFLGDLTNEIENEDCIETFVSGGPKNYAYKTKRGKETCKVRGFTLNYTNSKLINFDVVKQMVLSSGRDGNITLTNPSKICRDKYGAKIYNRLEQKKYQIVYTKRVIQPDLTTLPYGY